MEMECKINDREGWICLSMWETVMRSTLPNDDPNDGFSLPGSRGMRKKEKKENRGKDGNEPNYRFPSRVTCLSLTVAD